MTTDSGVSPEAKQRLGTVGGVRYHRPGDGAPLDRWGRSETQVKYQRDLAAAIVKSLSECRQRAPELEFGRTLGGKQLRRLDVAIAGFQRLMERDSRVLAEFENLRETEQASPNSSPAALYRLARERAETNQGAAA